MNYVWKCVFLRGFDSNDRVTVLKPSRFGHGYKVAEDKTFENALEFCIGIYSVDVISYLEPYVVGVRLWKKNPGGHSRTSNGDDESLIVSSVRARTADANHAHEILAFCH